MFLVCLGSAESMTEPRKVRIPPGIVSMPWVGKTYAISGGDWIEVPEGTTRDQIDQWMVYAPERPEAVEAQTWEVEGSKGKIYTVRFDGRWSCTCAGFKFRRECKHTNAQKKTFI